MSVDVGRPDGLRWDTQGFLTLPHHGGWYTASVHLMVNRERDTCWVVNGRAYPFGAKIDTILTDLFGEPVIHDATS